MFGSNFFGNFGIPEQQPFPYQGADPQGGMLAPNAPAPGQDMSTNAAPGSPAAPASPIGGPPATPALGAPSPLAGSPLAPGGAPPPQPEQPGQAPAAGVGSPFGKPS